MPAFSSLTSCMISATVWRGLHTERQEHRELQVVDRLYGRRAREAADGGDDLIGVLVVGRGVRPEGDCVDAHERGRWEMHGDERAGGAPLLVPVDAADI